MGINFRKLKIGFVTLVIDSVEKEDYKTAIRYAESAKEYLKNQLGTEIIEYSFPVISYVQAVESWKLFKANNVDAVIIFNGTFNFGNFTAEIIRNLDCPFLLWGLEEIGLQSGHFTGSMTALLASSTIFKNLNKKYTFAFGSIQNEVAINTINVFVKVVRGISYLREAVIGVIGMRPDGFEISDYDELSIKRIFGTEIVKISMYSFSDIVKSIGGKAIEDDMEIQKKIFEINKENIPEARELSRMYLALKKVIEEKGLRSYAPDCWPEFRDMDKCSPCPANGRFNSEGVMASCECDLDGSLTLMLQYAITGTTPWFADFLNIIKENNTLLFWHCGNSPYNLSKSKPVIERVFGGLGEVTALKSGIATVCRLNSIKGEYTIHAGVGEVVETKPLLKGSNLSIRMEGGNMEFVKSMLENGIPHHNGIVYGNILEELKEFANLMNIPIVIKK